MIQRNAFLASVTGGGGGGVGGWGESAKWRVVKMQRGETLRMQWHKRESRTRPLTFLFLSGKT